MTERNIRMLYKIKKLAMPNNKQFEERCIKPLFDSYFLAHKKSQALPDRKRITSLFKFNHFSDSVVRRYMHQFAILNFKKYRNMEIVYTGIFGKMEFFRAVQFPFNFIDDGSIRETTITIHQLAAHFFAKIEYALSLADIFSIDSTDMYLHNHKLYEPSNIDEEWTALTIKNIFNRDTTKIASDVMLELQFNGCKTHTIFVRWDGRKVKMEV